MKIIDVIHGGACEQNDRKLECKTNIQFLYNCNDS